MVYNKQFIYDNGFFKKVYICPNCKGHEMTLLDDCSLASVVYKCESCGNTCGSPVWEDIHESFLPIREILKKVGMFASDIKIRLNNKQMKLNGVVVAGTETLDVYLEDCIQDCGEFLFDTCMKNPLWALKLKILGLEEYFDDDVVINDDLSEYLKGYKLLKVSKKQSYIIKLFGNLE